MKKRSKSIMAVAVAALTLSALPVPVVAHAGGLNYTDKVESTGKETSDVKFSDPMRVIRQVEFQPLNSDNVGTTNLRKGVVVDHVGDRLADGAVLVRTKDGLEGYVPFEALAYGITLKEVMEFSEDEGMHVCTLKKCTLFDEIPSLGYLSKPVMEVSKDSIINMLWWDEDPEGWCAVKVGEKLGFLPRKVITFDWETETEVSDSSNVEDDDLVALLAEGYEVFNTPQEMKVKGVDISLRSVADWNNAVEKELLTVGTPLTVLASDGYPLGWRYVKSKNGNEGFVCAAHIEPIITDFKDPVIQTPSDSTQNSSQYDIPEYDIPEYYEELNETLEMYVGDVPISLLSMHDWTSYSKEVLLPNEVVTVIGTDGMPQGWRYVISSSGEVGNVCISHLSNTEVNVNVDKLPSEDLVPPDVGIESEVEKVPEVSVETTPPTTSSSMPDIYTALEVPQNMFVGSVPINLYSAPDWNNSYGLETLLTNDQVTVIGTDGFDQGWRYVQTASGQYGNVCISHLSSTQIKLDVIAPPSENTSAPEYNEPAVQQPSSGRRLLGSYFYELWTDGNSMTNVRLAANAVNANGWVGPWSTWSFHNRVGSCTTEPYVVAGIIGGEARGGGICALTTAMSTAAVRSGLNTLSNPHTERVTNVENGKARAMAEGLPFLEAMVSADGSDFHIYSNQNPLEIKVSTDWNEGYGYHWINVEIYEYQ